MKTLGIKNVLRISIIFSLIFAFLNANAQTTYYITEWNTLFYARVGDPSGSYLLNAVGEDIQRVINAIGDDANGADCTIQFGNGTDVLNFESAGIVFDNGIYPSGLISLAGKITSSYSATITFNDNISVNCAADIGNTNNDEGIGILYNSTGTLTITGGNISAKGDFGVINNQNTGTVIINGGTVQATSGTGNAIVNMSTGIVNIRGNAQVSATTGMAIINFSTGAVNISGNAQVSATYGVAITNATAGKISISGNAQVTATNTFGTINLSSAGNASTTATVNIEITGGRVYNADGKGNAILSYSQGVVKITGGVVSTPGYRAVYINNNNGSILLGGNPDIGGLCYPAGKLNLITSGNTDAFAPDAKKLYTLEPTSPVHNAVAVTNGAAFSDNFDIPDNNWGLFVSGNDLVLKRVLTYFITGSSGAFTARRVDAIIGAIVPGANGVTIQEVIDAIKADADGIECFIQFGDSRNTLDIGDNSIVFDGGGSGTDWGLINLAGNITSSKSTAAVVTLTNGVSAHSVANIENTGSGGEGIRHNSTGTLTITNGYISVPEGGHAIYQSNAGGSIELGGNPAIAGRIYYPEGKFSLIAAGVREFAPDADKLYVIELAAHSLNAIAVPNGATRINNFETYSEYWKLAQSGNDLVLALDVPKIRIITQPAENTDVAESFITGALSIEAKVTQSGTPAYEWFSNTTDSNTGGVSTGVTTADFTIPATLKETGSPYYYYCVVTAAGATPVTSDLATVSCYLHPFCGGDGTPEDPYLICFAEQLNRVRYNLSSHFRLENDIDLSLYANTSLSGWVAIGTPDNPFTGSFNGAGHKITNLWAWRSVNYYGLFGYTDGAVIDSLGVEISGRNLQADKYVGGLVGYCRNSTISNCYVKGEVTAKEFGWVGGLTGVTDNSVITNCYFEGIAAATGVTKAAYHIGIIPINIEKVDGTGINAGGLTGLNTAGSIISNCYAKGTVSGWEKTGGLVGENDNATIKNCVAANTKITLGTKKTTINRITGSNINSGALINNYANQNMKVKNDNGDRNITSTISLNGLAGADATLNAMKTLAFYNTGSSWDGGAWDIDMNASQSVWTMWNNITDLPHLRWQGTGAYFPPKFFCGGDGTAEDPYQICNAQQLDSIRFFSDKHFILMNDIDLTDYLANGHGVYDYWGAKGWSPIGGVAGARFSGEFNGKGHKITGLWINRSDKDEENIGLFGMAINAVIDSLSVEIAPEGITGYDYVGGLVGSASDTEIRDCYTTGEITGRFGIGGLVGRTTDNTTISNCYATGNVTSEYWAGGLVGVANGSIISNCYATGSVTGKDVTGGLVGKYRSGAVTDCHATGNVTINYENGESGGGLVGDADDITISNCYATGNVTGVYYTGGLMGYANNSTLSNCYAKGKITGNMWAGGLVGVAEGNSSILNCSAEGNVTTNRNSAGGLVGMALYSTISNCSAIGNVKGEYYAGGLVGSGGFFNISTSFATGDVKIDKYDAGGLVGGISASIVTNCYATGNVTAGNYGAGGLAGTIAENSFISYCYATGDIESNTLAGGLVGYIDTNKEACTIKNCVAANNLVKGISAAYVNGRITANPGPDGTVLTNNYGNEDMEVKSGAYNNYYSPEMENFQGINVSLDALTTLDFWANASNWDVVWDITEPTSVWIINDDGINLPYLRWQSYPFGAGTGAVENPFKIYNAEQLNSVRNYLDKHFILMNDIDLTDFIESEYPVEGWLPIGDFKGSFGGKDHKITGLWINRSDGDYTGLFGHIDRAYLNEISVEIAPRGITGKNYVGGLAGCSDNNSTILNCAVTGKVTGNDYVGGLVGSNTMSFIHYCYSTAAVTGNNNVGGFAGSNTSLSTINNCYTTGNVTGNNYTGGFAGYNQNTNIRYCYAAGVVNGGEGYTGGFFGYNATSGISDCYFDSQTTGQANGTGAGTSPANLFAKTTTEMRQQATFVSWDFTTVWNICELDGYPYLQWQDDYICTVTPPSIPDDDGNNVIDFDLYTIGMASKTVIVDFGKGSMAASGISSITADKGTVTNLVSVVHYSLTGTNLMITNVYLTTLTSADSPVTLTVTFTNAASTTAEITINVTNIVPTTYGLSIGTFANGTVSANKANYEEGETVTLTITPDAGYELATIAAFKTGDISTIVALSGSGDTRTFTMPDYGVTVTATFQKTADQNAVESAKTAIEGGSYTVSQEEANTEAAVKTWLVAQINALLSDCDITITDANITLSSFSAATAGTAGTPTGTNGSFSFTVSLTKGSSSATTASKSGTITATAYVAPANYAITISGTTNGTVTASSLSAAEGTSITLTITPNAGYELATISAFKTGDISTVITLSNSGDTYTFEMPAYNVTVTATFQKTQGQSNMEALESAKASIEGGTYRIAQGTGNDATTVKTWLVNTLNVLFGQAHNVQFRASTDPIIGDVNITTITPAIGGTEAIPDGIDGSFKFTVTLTRDAATLTTVAVPGVIVATPYDNVSGIINVETERAPSLQAWSREGKLHISGLITGEMLNIYSITGILVYQSIAVSDEADISLNTQGIYIVRNGGRAIKVKR